MLRSNLQRLVVFASLVVTVGAASLGAWMQSLNTQMKGDLEAIHKLGVPLSEQKSPLPVTDNAAQKYLSAASMLLTPGPTATAFTELKKHDVYGLLRENDYDQTTGRVALPKSTNPKIRIQNYGLMPQRDPRQAALYIKDLKPVTDLIDAASQMSTCVFSDGDFVRVSDRANEKAVAPYWASRTISELLFSKASVEANSHDDEAAIRDLETCSQIIRQLNGGQPLDLWTWESANVDDLQRRFLALAERHPEDSKLISAMVKISDSLGNPKSVLSRVKDNFPKVYGEYQSALDNPRAYWDTHQTYGDTYYENSIGMKVAVGQALHRWRQVFGHMPRDPNDAKGISKLLGDAQADMSDVAPAGNILDLQFTTDKTANLASYQLPIIEFRLLKSALKLLDIRARTGVFPASLPSFGDDSVDLFSMKKFIYRATTKTFTLYSVGFDGVDNGGYYSGQVPGNPPTDIIHQGIDPGITYER